LSAFPVLSGEAIVVAARHRLTDRQASVLTFITDYKKRQGYPPTLREIGARFGIRSTNGVNDHLRALERKGAISREDMKSRGIKVLDSPLLSEAAVGELAESRVEAQRLRGLLRKLYLAVRADVRETWRLDAVAAEISADFADHGESL
jgi:SOS-response transcriptional repressor LexA